MGDEDHDDDLSVCTSSSSSWATSDDERRLALRVVRRARRPTPEEKVSEAQPTAPTTEALASSPKAESPVKSPSKKKKKASSKAAATVPRDVGAKPQTPTKKKKTEGDNDVKQSPMKKSSVKKKKATGSTSSPSKVTPSERQNPRVESPTKKKKKPKEHKVEDAANDDASPKAEPMEETSVPSPKKKKAITSTNQAAGVSSSIPEQAETSPATKKKKVKAVKNTKKKAKSMPKRPHTAPTVPKKKVTLSSDDDSGIENGLSIKAPSPMSPNPTKSRFTFSSDDDSSSSDDSSDSGYGMRRRYGKLGARTKKQETQELQQGKTPFLHSDSDESESSSDASNRLPRTEVNENFERSIPARSLSGTSTDSEPPIPLGLRPGRKARSMSLGSTDSEPPISLSMRPGQLSRTISVETTDSEPPISLSLRPGQLRRSMSTDTTDSEPPFPLSLRPGGGPMRTYSASSTDSEPPFPLGLRPGAPARAPSPDSSSGSSDPPFPLGLRPGATVAEQKNFRDDHDSDERLNLRSPPRTYSTDTTDSEPPIPLGLRPGAPNLGRSYPESSKEVNSTEAGGSHESSHDISYMDAAGALERTRKSKPIVPCPSYVPNVQEDENIQTVLLRPVKGIESKSPESIISNVQEQESIRVVRPGKTSIESKSPDQTICLQDQIKLLKKPNEKSNNLNDSANGSECSWIRNLTPVDHAKVHESSETSQYDPLSEVSLRHVPIVEKPKQKKGRRRRESFLFRDLQRFAKKTANEIQSEDEGLSDDGLSDDGSDKFVGEQSLNLLDALEDDSDNNVNGTNFYQSAPITAIQSNIIGQDGVIEPSTPKFEEIRKAFLRMTAKNEADDGSPLRRGRVDENPCRRHSALVTDSPGMGALQNGSSSNGLSHSSIPRDGSVTVPNRGNQIPSETKAVRRHSALIPTAPQEYRCPGRRNSISTPQAVPHQLESVANVEDGPRKVPNRVPSASLSNIVSLRDRIKLLPIGNGGNEEKLEEQATKLYASPQKNRLSKLPDSGPKCDTHKPVSSSMDALLSPRKDFSSKHINRSHGAQFKNSQVKGGSHVGKQDFSKSMGTIPFNSPDAKASSTTQPIWADKGLLLKKKVAHSSDPNHDSLENLQATVQALRQEIDKVEESSTPLPAGAEDSSEGGDSDEEDKDRFNASMTAGNGLSQYFSKAKPSGKSIQDDEKSMESTLSYDVQDVLTSFSQQRKLAMQRARAARPSGGKLGDRLKFLQSS